MTDLVHPPMNPAARARLSLEGLATGDAFGETLFRYRSQVRTMAEARTPAPGPWPWTDDTAMAISIVEELEQHAAIDQDALATRFGRRYRAEPARGYGGGAHRLLERISNGDPWKPAARAMFGATGSYGNGSAMRVAPIGAWFADDLDAVVVQASRSAEVTHAHPEGEAGAIAVAVAAALAWRTRTGRWDGPDFLAAVIERTPTSETRSGIERAAQLPAGTSPEDAAAILGCGHRVSAQDTVPFSLWCVAQDPDDFEGTLWTTGRGLGDVDTTCAMVGGITVLRTGADAIPRAWLDAREPLPASRPSKEGLGHEADR
jgi:ADP-ribosylglycohydrolase